MAKEEKDRSLQMRMADSLQAMGDADVDQIAEVLVALFLADYLKNETPPQEMEGRST